MGLRVVAVSDPAAPVEIASIPVQNGHTNRTFVVGKRAYVADGYAGMKVLDLADPLAPKIMATSQEPIEAREIRIFGNYAVVADRGELRASLGQYQPAVRILDLSALPPAPIDPTDPTDPVDPTDPTIIPSQLNLLTIGARHFRRQ